MAEASTQVIHDFLVRWLLPLIAYSKDWGEISGTYLTQQEVDQVAMYVSEWHSGMDNTELQF
eukprot:5442541-Karenia_brevis.AAC.1